MEREKERKKERERGGIEREKEREREKRREERESCIDYYHCSYCLPLCYCPLGRSVLKVNIEIRFYHTR